MPQSVYTYSTLEVDPRQFAESLPGGNAEVVHLRDHTNEKYPPVELANTVDSPPVPYNQSGQRTRRWCGLSPVWFWSVVALCVVLVVAFAAGLGVGFGPHKTTPSNEAGTQASNTPATTTSPFPQATVAGSPGLSELRKRYNVPGLAVGYLKDAKLTSEVVGVRKQGDSTPLENSDKFHLGACSATMTATLAASMIEDGLFDWNTTMKEAFVGTRINPKHYNTTVAMLAVHMAGLMGGTSPTEYGTWWNMFNNASVTPFEARRRFAEYILQQEPRSTPRTEQKWSNPGYIVLSAIMESKGGRSWDDSMQKFFDKLGMTGCGFGVQPESSRSSVENPWPHTSSSDGPVPVIPDALHGDNPAAVWPALGIHCTMESYSKFLQFQLNGYYGRSTPLLKKGSFAKLQSASPRFKHSYTYGGWRFDPTSANGSEYWISGSNTKNYAWSWLLVERDEAFMSMTNVGDDVGYNASLAAIYWIGGYTVPPVDT